jgi:alkane 1-monooxygenase
MRLRAFKYLSPLLVYAGAIRSFTVTGWEIWMPLIYAWVIIPAAELFIRPDPKNMSAEEEELAQADPAYDFLLYGIVILQYLILSLFLMAMTQDKMTIIDIAGRVWVMGLLCGIFGINVGHELGHRSRPFEQVFARMLLLTSQYMHFFIEHNKGHHKRVATDEDPSSARYGEWIYGFYLRSIVFSYLSAWQIAIRESRRKNKRVVSLDNEMVRYTLIQIIFVVVIFMIFGGFTTFCYLVAAFIGILLLETVNYIEHYGLKRKQIAPGRYERAMPAHSWNSDHIIGRLMLFELSRHSDHHYLASRKYQTLRHHADAPQMPTGYPGMMILSLIPPAWFYVMNKKIGGTRPETRSPSPCTAETSDSKEAPHLRISK